MDQQQEWKRPLQQDDDPQGSEASPLVSSKTFRAPDAPASSPVITAPPGDPGAPQPTTQWAIQLRDPDADDPRGVDQDPPAPSAPPGDSSYSAVPVVVDGSIARVRPRDGRIDTSHSRTFAWGLICNATPIILGVSALVVYLMEPQSKNALYISYALPAAYVLYVILACCSGSAKALRNRRTHSELSAFVDERIASRARVIIYRHHETRYRTVTTKNSDGSTSRRQESYTVTVTTFRETIRWAYSSWVDTSQVPPDFTDLGPVRLKNVQVLDFADALSRCAFDAAYRAMYEQNKWRDVHCDTSWRSHILVYDPNTANCCMSSSVFSIATLLLGAWFYEMWLERSVVRANYAFVKTVFAR